MKTIYKYPLEITDNQCVKMPKDAQILTVQMQGKTPCLWAMVDTENEVVERFIEIYGTGNPITGQDSRRYISTFQVIGGALIFHAFEYTGI